MNTRRSPIIALVLLVAFSIIVATIFAGCARKNENTNSERLQYNITTIEDVDPVVVTEIENGTGTWKPTFNEEPRKLGKHRSDNAYQEVKYTSGYYYSINDTTSWDGEYLVNCIHRNNDGVYDREFDRGAFVLDYRDYAIKIARGADYTSTDGNKWKYYGNHDVNYIVAFDIMKANTDVKVIDCTYENGKIILYTHTTESASARGNQLTFIALPTTLQAGTPVEWRKCQTVCEIEEELVKEEEDKHGSARGWNANQMLDKPMIYLYPECEQDITLKLGEDTSDVTVSYPKYTDGWNVHASPDGNLVDNKTGRALYGLYYERKSLQDIEMTDTGFVVKGDDAASFLEEKLAILGLNDREAEEFIVYWLPQLEANDYSYIRFATEDEIQSLLPLDVSPKPDCNIRVLIFFKGLDEPISVEEQQLIPKNRDGYTLVEWGGAKI